MNALRTTCEKTTKLRRRVCGRALVGLTLLCLITVPISGCATAQDSGDRGEIGSGPSEYPLGDTGEQRLYDRHNELVRDLGL